MAAEQEKPRSNPWEAIKQRCDAANIKAEQAQLTVSPVGSTERAGPLTISFCIIHFPNGPTTRDIAFAIEAQPGLSAIEFEKCEFLGDYAAIWNKSDGAIEAQIAAGYPQMPLGRLIPRIPNFEALDVPGETEREAGAEQVTVGPDGLQYGLPGTMPRKWRVHLAKEGTSIELSPPSNAFGILVRNMPLASNVATLKLVGFKPEDYHDAVRVLNEVGNAFLFELDVCTNMQLSLDRANLPGPRIRGSDFGEHPARFPAATYPLEALALYQYARSASELPLLQFLAYYQAIEFFFPIYSRREVMRRLRVALKNPRFDVNDDVALNRVLSIILPEGKAGVTEREQLRLTLRACLEPATIREFIESSPEYDKHFTAKAQDIQGASRILLHEGQPDLRDQAADRIYAIRCRVVHTKQEGGDGSVGLLLPSSPEAFHMGPDIELMRLIAQQVLAAAGQTMRV